jgi:hypothetical protein
MHAVLGLQQNPESPPTVGILLLAHDLRTGEHPS